MNFDMYLPSKHPITFTKETPMLYNIPKLQHVHERLWINPAAVAGVRFSFGENAQVLDIKLDARYTPKGVTFAEISDGVFVKVSTLIAVLWQADPEKGANVYVDLQDGQHLQEFTLPREKVNEIVELYTNEILQAISLGDDEDDWSDLDDDDLEDLDLEDTDDEDEDGDYDDPFDVDEDGEPEHPFDEV